MIKRHKIRNAVVRALQRRVNNYIVFEGSEPVAINIELINKLPDRSGMYLCFIETSDGTTVDIHCLSYSQKHKRFNCYDCFTEEKAEQYHIPVKVHSVLTLDEIRRCEL